MACWELGRNSPARLGVPVAPHLGLFIMRQSGGLAALGPASQVHGKSLGGSFSPAASCGLEVGEHSLPGVLSPDWSSGAAINSVNPGSVL